ncbi:hypothetical protein N7450_006513 [Penicillium hetheringtonii]|uniref:Uncharacterized protein n=1 Tax=Penicillium hetheringtonii TaxID=911720 RepID=A0AAD6DI74_9EURO|nr:hypothetical protein N7450_006513 [Penicillium hetheringtonii]
MDAPSAFVFSRPGINLTIGDRFYPRKLAIGGATSTSCKVAIISKSERHNIDVDYTVVQIALGQPMI